MSRNFTIYFLIGMPGVGKSYFGKKASEIQNIKFFDTDFLVEEKCKLKIYEIFEKYGEDYFRKIESEVLINTVEECREHAIIATGGGTPANENLMDFMNKNGITIWLKADLDYLVKRIKKQNKTRPLLRLEPNLKENLGKLLNKRKEIYAKSKLNIEINEGLTPILFTNTLLLSTFE